MDPSPERAARAQTIFRAGNEALERAAGSRVGTIPFICECGDEMCMAEVPLGRDAYEQVRAHARRFFVAAGHETAGDDDALVVERRDGYSVIEKQAAAGALAAETDPRNRRQEEAS